MSNRPLITVEVNTDALADKLDQILEILKTIEDANPGHVERAPAGNTGQDLPELVDSISDADTTTSMPVLADDTGTAPPAVPFSNCPPNGRKTICKDWLHHGTCSYPECKWAHEMPQDLKALRRGHLDAFPRWYVDKQAATQESLSGQASRSPHAVTQPQCHIRVFGPPRPDVEVEIPTVIRDGVTLDRLERTEYRTYNLERPFPTAKDVYEELCSWSQTSLTCSETANDSLTR